MQNQSVPEALSCSRSRSHQMSGKRILLVEDERTIREMVTFALRQDGYLIDEAEDGSSAEIKMAEHLPDLILLDWMLPNVSGLELLRRWKRNESTQEIPVIMLTAKVEERDKLDGLDSGADDYIAKPFSVKELSARIRAVLRRGAGTHESQVSIGPIKLDSKAHRVYVHGESINLGPNRVSPA